jgi:hypothetical protein
MATEYRPDSNYRITPIVNNKYLDIYTSPIINTSDFETTNIIIENKFNNRPDLLAYNLYGNSKLWWVFAEFNPDTLIDPIIDFVGGMKITVPTRFG